MYHGDLCCSTFCLVEDTDVDAGGSSIKEDVTLLSAVYK
jgi:hypothetical protein